MNRAASRSPLAFVFLALIAGAETVFPDVPVVPFSGVYASAAGAGSLAGWERHGGDNPAVFGEPGLGVSVAGYAPFGLEELRVLETSAVRDRGAWGASVAWRALFAGEHPRASVATAQFALKVAREWSGGVSWAYHAGDGNPGVVAGLGAAAGLLWRPFPFLSFGGAWERLPALRGSAQRAGFGGEGGGTLGAGHGTGYAWRVSAEHFLQDRGPAESRYGFGLRFHPLLSAYAGFSPQRETAALGIRFGMGGFEGFSALRRHGSLGGTSIQGLQWRGKGF